MQIRVDNLEIRVFMHVPRTIDKSRYLDGIHKSIQFSEQYGCTGILILTSNDMFVDPWVVVQWILSTTQNVSPLIAVNPVYMHPFTAAKMVSSYANIYGRKVFLNMVAGTAVNQMEALNDSVAHDARYDRLTEYIEVMRRLLGSTQPVNWPGRYYQCNDLQLLPGVEQSLLPEYFIAGSSDAAKKLCATIGGTRMQMLKLPNNLSSAEEFDQAVCLGIITRQENQAAWQAAHHLFPEDEIAQIMLELSVQNADAVWKQRMKREASQDYSDTGYWLSPFKNLQSDSPYFVGDYEHVANLLIQLIEKGIRNFILDVPPIEQELQHIQRAFEICRSKLQSRIAINPVTSQESEVESIII